MEKNQKQNISLKQRIEGLLLREKGLNPKLVKYMTFPIYLKIKKLPVLTSLKELEKSQWFDRDQIRELQLKKLKKLLAYCQEYVPYYQKIFKENDFNVNDLKEIDELGKLPVLEKSLVIENRNSLRSQEKGIHFFKVKTSGSTGFPLEFLNNYGSVSRSMAAQIRAKNWWNLDYGLREAHFWARGLSKTTSFKIRLVDLIIRNKIMLRSLDLSKDAMFSYYKRLIKFDPHIIYGNPSAIYIFSRFIFENKLDMSAIKPRAIISTTEVLHDYQRQFISKTFNCPTINEYGSSEVGIIAYECPEHNMHLSTDNIIIEIMKNGKQCKPGVFGEIIITNLNNYIMPFIRYRLGDVGKFLETQCACGRKLPLLDLTIGRDCDRIILKDRELPGGQLFGRLGKELNFVTNGALESFKIFQKDLDKFVFQAVMRTDGQEYKLENRANEAFKDLMGPNISIKFEYVDSIPPERSGKRRYFVSEVLNRN